MDKLIDQVRSILPSKMLVVVIALLVIGGFLPQPTRAAEWELVEIPPEVGTDLKFEVEFKDKLYFVSFLENSRKLYEYDGSNWTKVIVNGSDGWSWVKYHTTISDNAYFSFKASLFAETLYKFDGNTWTETIASGSWSSVEHLVQINGVEYFALKDDSRVAHLYSFDGQAWTELSLPAPPSEKSWNDLYFETEANGQWYFSYLDSSYDAYLYQFDGATWTEITPAPALPDEGVWLDISHITTVGQDLYFTFEFDNWFTDNRYEYLYVLNGDEWTNITPDDYFANIDFVAEIDGKFYFLDRYWRDIDIFYEVDGKTVTKFPLDLFPDWKSILFMIQKDDVWYVGMEQYPYDFYVYEFDGENWSDTNAWKDISGDIAPFDWIKPYYWREVNGKHLLRWLIVRRTASIF